MTKLERIFIVVAIIVGIISGVASLTNKEAQAPSANVGSVSISNEYHATTTSTGRFNVPYTLQTISGTLGSVIITGAATGVINIYDATTTNASLRSADQATSSILIATFPASAAANTYTFDQIFTRGLIYDVVGTMPTTTVTYR